MALYGCVICSATVELPVAEFNLDDCGVCDVIRMVSLDRKTVHIIGKTVASERRRRRLQRCTPGCAFDGRLRR